LPGLRTSALGARRGIGRRARPRAPDPRERMRGAVDPRAREALDAAEAQLRRLLRGALPGVRPPRRAEEPVPQAERDPEVHAARPVGGPGAVVVPHVHPRRVEDVPQRPPGEVEVAVVEVADQRRDDGDRQDDVAPDAEGGQRQVGQPAVDDDLHPVEAEAADPVELLDRVVHLVELPQPGHAVQQVVHPPLEQVLQHEEHDELDPEGPGRDQPYGLEALQARRRPGEGASGRHAQEDARDVPVEEEPEEVLADLGTQDALAAAPRPRSLQRRHGERHDDQPERVAPRVPDGGQQGVHGRCRSGRVYGISSHAGRSRSPRPRIEPESSEVESRRGASDRRAPAR